MKHPQDFVFPCFHGAGGEDGTFQGLLEFFGVPYAGCGIAASSTAIDKGLTKNLFRAENIDTTSYVTITEQNFLKYFEMCVVCIWFRFNKQTVCQCIQMLGIV